VGLRVYRACIGHARWGAAGWFGIVRKIFKKNKNQKK
jgi:hypothetical protein